MVIASTLVLALVVASCSADDRSGARDGTTRPITVATPSGQSGFPATWTPKALTWKPCSGPSRAANEECARLAVPLDWADPGGPTIDLAIGRIRATGTRLGSLFMNPGGPGGSGLDFLSYQPFQAKIAKGFDLVSWDPRGVGDSTAVKCGDHVPAFLAIDPDPDTPAEQARLDAAAAAVSTECATDDADLLAHIGTPDTVRDMEAIRLALGGEAMNYVGFSYGTEIGQLYAQFFPDRIRSMVLDGVVDPAEGFTQFLSGQARAFDANFVRFDRECTRAGTTSCGVSDLGATYDEVARQVDRTPLKVASEPAGRQNLGPAELAVAAVYSLYLPDGWKDLGPALADARRGDGKALMGLADSYYDLGGFAAYAGITCLDTPSPQGAPAFAAFAAEARTISARFGGSIANELLPCATWPVRPPDGRASLGPITAPGTAPLLVIGNTEDPATPYDNAVAVAGRLGSATLLTVELAGHTAYGTSTCATRVTDAYLLDPDKPLSRTHCP